MQELYRIFYTSYNTEGNDSEINEKYLKGQKEFGKKIIDFFIYTKNQSQDLIRFIILYFRLLLRDIIPMDICILFHNKYLLDKSDHYLVDFLYI